MHPPVTPRLAWLTSTDPFPPLAHALTEESGANGLLAASDGLTSEMLVRAYQRGIFPWSGPGEPLLWWSPDPRLVLFVAEFKLHRSLRQAAAKAAREGFRLACDTAFDKVILACSEPRPGQAGSWITPQIVQGYSELHAQGKAHSVELWHGQTLVGGLYLVSLGSMVFGESMFSRVPNASKLCLAALVRWLARWDTAETPMVIDCQQETRHLASMGARAVSRGVFVDLLRQTAARPALPWPLDPLALNIGMLAHGQSS